MNNTNITQWLKYSVTFRIVIVGVLALLLLIPVGFISNLIHERENTKREAVSEISQKWGEQQTIAGPILSIPYKKYATNEKGENISVTKYAHFLPETLFVDGTIDPQVRSRGIFDAVVYSSKINFSGKFAWHDIYSLGIKDFEIDWDNAFISVGVSDIRGINDKLKLTWNNKEIEFQPGVITNDVIRSIGNNYDLIPYERNLTEKSMMVDRSVNMEIGQSSGISAQLPANIRYKNAAGHDFSFKLNLNGSRDLQFVPVGRTTEVSLKSDWGNPSFGGAFLPDTREVTDNEFNASWKILDLNRGYPQSWLGNNYNIYSSASGVKLLAGVDDYTKATRSVKYALLIIALTFLVFFFVEVFNKKKIHPIQYILVGLAIVLFYSLLVSISEIISFGLAYLISAVATIGLITLYSKSVLSNTKMVLIQGSILSFLYLFIYIILQLEDYALLIGNSLLFLILAGVMYLSRKVDWYAVGTENQNN